MKIRFYHIMVAALLVAAFVPTTSCERSTNGLDLAPLDTNPVVFRDEFDGIDYQAFLGSKLDAFDVDTQVWHGGGGRGASIKFDVPDEGDPSGGYAGGVIVANMARDLSQYNALAFWAKASQNAVLDGVGYGNDNTGTSKYIGGVTDLALTTNWQRFIVPIPRTGKLVPERGLLWFADAPDGGVGYTVWLDQIEFVKVDAISNPRPVMRQGNVSAITGVRLNVSETWTVFDVTVPSPKTLTVLHSPAYFTFASTNEDVAVPGEGVIRVVGGGTAEITATLEGLTVAGRFTISALDPPADAAPKPTVPAANVISIFSNAYTNRTVDSFSPDWEDSGVSNLKIAGNDVKVYNIPTALDIAAIEFATQTINASAMTHVHIDIWAPAGTFFGLGLVDFGADGICNESGGDDSDDIVAIVPPQLVFNQWLSLDIPLADYDLNSRQHLAQIILRSDSVQLIVDNIFFYKAGN